MLYSNVINTPDEFMIGVYVLQKMWALNTVFSQNNTAHTCHS